MAALTIPLAIALANFATRLHLKQPKQEGAGLEEVSVVPPIFTSG